MIQATYGTGKISLRLATGSPFELGLVEQLAYEFNKFNDTNITCFKAGSGDSLRLLEENKVDLVMVHAPKIEEKMINDKKADYKKIIGSNEFFILGCNDTAFIKDSKDVYEAYQKIFDKKALFITRDDDSGTNKKELEIWKRLKLSPRGDWYIKNREFMLDTLLKADQIGAYFMCDSSTFYVAKNKLKNMKILFKDNKNLLNVYSALKNSDNEKAKEFIDFLVSQRGQEIISNFGKKEYGTAIYNGAEYTKELLKGL